jgi:hypothetical protein
MVSHFAQLAMRKDGDSQRSKHSEWYVCPQALSRVISFLQLLRHIGHAFTHRRRDEQ